MLSPCGGVRLEHRKQRLHAGGLESRGRKEVVCISVELTIPVKVAGTGRGKVHGRIKLLDVESPGVLLKIPPAPTSYIQPV